MSLLNIVVSSWIYPNLVEQLLETMEIFKVEKLKKVAAEPEKIPAKSEIQDDEPKAASLTQLI